MIIGKALTGSTAATVSLANYSPAATGQAWQLTNANAITRLADFTVTGTSLSITVPPQTFNYSFTLRRSNPSQAATLPLTILTACGNWPTFVGGGTAAFQTPG